MTANLPEKEILLELPEGQRICGKCGGMFKPIGKKFVRHELQVIPRQVKLLAYYTVTYACDHCEKDTGFAQHGNVPISNNLAENAIRPFAVGRKNWLFCDTVKGAESSAIVYSMVETAKANGLDPYDYLLYALSVLPYYGKSASYEMLETAMPWSSEVQQRIGKQAQVETE